MAKTDKEFLWRMEGMIYALNIVKKDGIKALEDDIRKRNILKAPMKFTQKQMEEHWDYISNNIYNNILTTFFYTLQERQNLSKEEMIAFKEELDQHMQSAMDLDYMGMHYVKLEDYAIELNEKYNLGIDINRVAMCQDAHDENSEEFKTCKVERVLRELRSQGFDDAAAFLEEKIM